MRATDPAEAPTCTNAAKPCRKPSTESLSCDTVRSAIPNFVAVDFYDIGNLFEVVDALNGL